MLRATFVLTLVAAGFAGALWSRHVALLTYVWMALFRPFEWIYTDFQFLRPSLLAGLLLLVPCLMTGVLPNFTHPLTLLTGLFTATIFVAQLSSPYAGDWVWVDQFTRLTVVVCLAVSILNTRERLMQYVAVLAGSLAFFSAKGGIVSTLGGGVRFSGQAGSFIDNNGYALAVNMAIPLMAAVTAAGYAALPFRTVARVGFALAIPLSVFSVIGTMSRGGLVALAALAVVFALLQRRPVLWSLGVVLAGLLTFKFAPMPEGYLERVETISTFEEVGEVSALSRLHFWRVATRIASDRPFGVGLRRFDRAYDDYDFLQGGFGRGRSVHSSHFQVLAETGYLGFALWVALFSYALVACIRVRYAAARASWLDADERAYFRVFATALAASMVAFLAGGAFIALANNDLTWLTFGAVAAMQRQFVARRIGISTPKLPTPKVATVIPRRAAIA
jgi:putative inorganic carbon (HCO3(-)) transporter